MCQELVWSWCWKTLGLLLWWLGRELRALEPVSPTSAALRLIVLKMKRLTVTSLVLALLFGVGRALMFERYEYGAPLTHGIVILLIVKHIFFAGIVAWGLWVHITVRGRKPAPHIEPDCRAEGKSLS